MKLRAVILAAGLTLAAQDDPIFRSSVVNVQVPVTVLDKKGKIVEGLNDQDFVLLDGGIPQKFEVDSVTRPISLVVAVQTSSGTREIVQAVQKASSLLAPLVAGSTGEVSVLAFDHRLQVLTPFTSDADEIHAAFDQLKAGSSPHHLDDAAMEGIRMLNARNKDRKKILLLIGEANDNGSEVTTSDVLTQAELNGILVYAVSMPVQVKFKRTNPVPPEARGPAPMGVIRTETTDAQAGGYAPDVRQAYEIMKGLSASSTAAAYAKATGGRQQNFSDVRGLETAIERIGKEIHGQYMLTFAPQNRDGGYHEIVVQVTTPKLEVRARHGYWIGQNSINPTAPPQLR